MRFESVRKLVSVAAAAAVVVVLAVAGPAAFAAPQAKCPVMGGEIDKSVFVDYEGQRVYLCCPGCIKGFNADPARYMAKLKAEGVELEKAPDAAKAGSSASDSKACGCGDGKSCGKDCTCGCGCKEGKPCTCGEGCSCHEKEGAAGGCKKADGEKHDCGCGK